MNRYVITECRINGPKRRIDNLHIFYYDVTAFKELNERRTEHTALQRRFVVIRDFQILISVHPHLLKLVQRRQFSSVLLYQPTGIDFPSPPFEPVSIQSTSSGYR